MNEQEQFLADVEHFDEFEDSEKQHAVDRARWLRHADAAQWTALLDALRALPSESLKSGDPLLANAFHALADVLRNAGQKTAEASSQPGSLPDSIALLYRHLEHNRWTRAELLRALACGDADSLKAFGELLVNDPPTDSNNVVVAFSPLFQNEDVDAAALFPQLLDGLSHLSVASPILDLANYLTRTRRCDQHPATERAQSLSDLLGQLTQRLETLNEQGGTSPKGEVQTTIDESVALAVSLCDAIGLIGDPSLVGKLYPAMELSHRRIRTEAAAALARLGEDAGKQVLVEMASEPSVRRFVIAFAEELGLLEQVAPEHQTPEALAISDLAVWLAQPAQLGLPPQECELIDQREQYWPGYDDAVECFLIRFCYRIGEHEYVNVGIAGPLTHAFSDDLTTLPPDDLYAAFAGWDAQHEEIWELLIDELNDSQRGEVARLEARLRSAGYDAIQPAMLCSFFGKISLVARAMKAGRPAIAVISNEETFSRPTADSQRPLSAELVYQIYKGRQLLRTFNE